MIDLNALRSNTAAGTKAKIEEALGRIVDVVSDAAEDTSRPKGATLHLLVQMADAIEAVVNGSYTAAGLDGLHKRQPLELGAGPLPAAGSSSSISSAQAEKLTTIANTLALDMDNLIKVAEKMFVPFGTVSPVQRTARINMMALVADGSYKVEDDGVPVVHHQKEQLERELDQAKVERDKARQDLADATAGGGAVPKDQLDAAVEERNKLRKIVSDIKQHASVGKFSNRDKFVVDYPALLEDTQKVFTS